MTLRPCDGEAEELVEEEAKESYYRALVGSEESNSVPLVTRVQGILRKLSVPALESWLGVLIASYELRIDLGPDDFEGLWGTRSTGSDGYYSMLPKKDMA
ncbi:hypothetical protein Bca52824_001583 [Brassica carinata]|uniref:Uncharacterized protein n=1 Tax=Brassica carinata TaxID=52824 RepID=A0A8X7WLT8_BRACI|nr:hypothetical protein Bca52824_001583 [Brassica carinata]